MAMDAMIRKVVMPERCPECPDINGVGCYRAIIGDLVAWQGGQDRWIKQPRIALSGARTGAWQRMMPIAIFAIALYAPLWAITAWGTKPQGSTSVCGASYFSAV